MDTGFIQCYLQKKLTRSEALEYLTKNMAKNDDEKIIFSEEPSSTQKIAATSAAATHQQPFVPKQHSVVPVTVPPPTFARKNYIPLQPVVSTTTNTAAAKSSSSSATASPISSNNDYNQLRSEHTKLKMDHSKLKTEYEKLRHDFDAFKEETEHRIQQLFLAVTRQESVEDLMVSNLPIFFETNRMRKTFPIQIAFYDQPTRNVDLAEIMHNSPKCKDGITTAKEIADLFKDVLWKIFGRDNIHHYTAASSRVKKGLTPIAPEVIEAIRTLFYEGFRIDKSSKEANNPESGHKRNEIDRVIKSTSSYIFNNSRRSKNQSSPRNSVHGYYDDSGNQYYGGPNSYQHGHSISDESDSEGSGYPKRMRIIENLDDCFKLEPDAEF